MLNLAQIIQSLPAFPASQITKGVTNRGPHWFITGGLGFVGLHLIQRLGELGIPCIVLNRSTPQVAQRRLRCARPDLVSFVQGDVARPQWGLNSNQWNICRQSAVVVHLASELDVGKSLKSLAPVNSDSVEPLLDCLVHGARVLYLSSLSVFASSSWPVSVPCPERFPFTDEFFYGGYAQSKVLAEHRLIQSFQNGDLTICRPSLIFGDCVLPSRHLITLFNDALRKIGGIPETIPDEKVSLCQVDWVVECLVKLGSVTGNGLDFCHLAQNLQSLREMVMPLALPTISNTEFREKLEHLPPFAKTLLRNAFLKPQPKRYANHDLFQSTGRIYQTDHLQRYLI